MNAAQFILAVVTAATAIWFFSERRRRKTHSITPGIDHSTSLPHEVPIELYSNSFSHCSRKTRIVLEELGIEYKHHSIQLIETGWYETISPSYLRVNPSGLVPTLVHRGHPVYESDDILTYAQSIASSHAPALVPEDHTLRREMNDWLEFCAISSAGPMDGMQERAGACVPGLTLPLFMTSIQYIPVQRILIGLLFHFDRKRPLLFLAGKLLGLRRMMKLKPAQEIMHNSRNHMRGHLESLEQALEARDGDWILGDQYTLADVTLTCLLLRLEETQWLRWYQSQTNLSYTISYFNRLKGRTSWAKAIDAHQSPVVTLAVEDLRGALAADPSTAALLYAGSQPNSTSEKLNASW